MPKHQYSNIKLMKVIAPYSLRYEFNYSSQFFKDWVSHTNTASSIQLGETKVIIEWKDLMNEKLPLELQKVKFGSNLQR